MSQLQTWALWLRPRCSGLKEVWGFSQGSEVGCPQSRTGPVWLRVTQRVAWMWQWPGLFLLQMAYTWPRPRSDCVGPRQ